MIEYGYRYQIDPVTHEDQRTGYIAYKDVNSAVSDTVWIYQEGWDSRMGDSLSLAAFYHAMTGEQWYFDYLDDSRNLVPNGKWRLDRPLEEWNGITLEDGRLTGIYMHISNMRGAVPAEFCNAKKLKLIDLRGEYQTVCITSLPEELCNLVSLETLNLSNCAINDDFDIYEGLRDLPSTMDQMPNLKWLRLQMSGTFTEIPPVILRMKSLYSLDLSQVKFSGTIPEEIGNLTNLYALALYGFNTCEVGPYGFSGNLPESMKNLNLSSLDLGANNFEGSLPDWIGNQVNLYRLLLSESGFSGTLPTSMGNLTQLTQLDLSGNKFTGSIPEGIKNNAYFDGWQAAGRLEQLSGYGFDNTSVGGDNYHADGSVRKVQSSYIPNSLNLMIMGDGFIREDLREEGAYDAWAKRACDAFFDVEPYKTYKEYFNVYIVYNESAERGYSLMGNDKNTAFNTRFDGNTWTANSNRIFEMGGNIIGAHKVKEAVNILLVNTTDSWIPGVCWQYPDGSAITINPLTQDFDKVIVHEAGGHGFGKLADEYVSRGEALGKNREDVLRENFPNVDLTGDPAEVKWKHFIGRPEYPEIGVFEGGYYFDTGVWRPTENSVMNMGVGFNPPSREAIVKRIKLLAGEPYSFEEFLLKDRR